MTAKSILLWDEGKLVFELEDDHAPRPTVQKFLYGEDMNHIKSLMLDREIAFVYQDKILTMLFKLPNSKFIELVRRYDERN